MKKLPVRNRKPPFNSDITLYCRVSALCAQEIKRGALVHLPVLHGRTFWLKNLLSWSFCHWLTDSKVQGEALDGVKCQLGKLISLFYSAIFSGKKKPPTRDMTREQQWHREVARLTLSTLKRTFFQLSWGNAYFSTQFNKTDHRELISAR